MSRPWNHGQGSIIGHWKWYHIRYGFLAISVLKTHRFLRYSTPKNAVTSKTGFRGSVKVIENYSAAANVPYLNSRTVSDIDRIDGDFSRKSQLFLPLCNLRPRWRGSQAWNYWVSAPGVKKTRMTGYREDKEVWRYLHVWMHGRDYRLDVYGHRATEKTALTQGPYSRHILIGPAKSLPPSPLLPSLPLPPIPPLPLEVGPFLWL